MEEVYGWLSWANQGTTRGLRNRPLDAVLLRRDGGNREVPPGGWVGLGWVKASPGGLPTVRAAFPAGPDRAAVPGCPVTRPTGLLTAPRPRGGARGREMRPCLCVCALVCLWRGGRAVAHLLAPLLFGVGAHGAGKCVPGAPGPGREAGEPDSEPAGGDVGLGSELPRH